MSFTKADLEKEKDELNRLISEDEDARKAHQEFQARIALQQKLIQMIIPGCQPTLAAVERNLTAFRHPLP